MLTGHFIIIIVLSAIVIVSRCKHESVSYAYFAFSIRNPEVVRKAEARMGKMLNATAKLGKSIVFSPFRFEDRLTGFCVDNCDWDRRKCETTTKMRLSSDYRDGGTELSYHLRSAIRRHGFIQKSGDDDDIVMQAEILNDRCDHVPSILREVAGNLFSLPGWTLFGTSDDAKVLIDRTDATTNNSNKWRRINPWNRTVMVLLLVFFFQLLQQSIAQADPPKLTVTVTTSAGPVRGFEVDYGSDRSQLYYGNASIFLGVPFAKAPLGDLRFKLPQSLCLFDQAVGSTEYKPRCPQSHDYHGFDYLNSEDCLYLNVFTPNVTDGRKRAVMFYIPGGLYQLGGADIYDYKGAVRNLVSRDVVVVVTQYRVSTIGFFTTFTPEFPANRGIFDVLLALRWTANEIANFGGDPDRVTIFGHSAGAHFTDALTYSPLAKGLFQQVIIQSGPIEDGFRIPSGFGKNTTPEEFRAEKLCNLTSLTSSTLTQSVPLLQQCFAALSGQEIVTVDSGAHTYGMSLDGVIFPLAPTAVLAKMRTNYRVMLGDTTDEYAFSMDEVVHENITTVNESTLDHYLRDAVPYLNKSQLDRYKQAVLAFYNVSLEADAHLGWTKLVSRIITDHNYYAPARKNLQWWKNHNNSNNVFLYDFDYFNALCANSYQVEGWTPSIHCAELCFLWFYSYEWEKAAAEGRIRPSDLEVADNLGRAWTNFAKYGNPGWSAMGNRFEYVTISDEVSDVRKDWADSANRLFNEKLPALMKMNLPPFHIDRAVKAQIERQAPSIMNSWLSATCPSWKPLKTTSLTVFPYIFEEGNRIRADESDASVLPSVFSSLCIVIIALYL